MNIKEFKKIQAHLAPLFKKNAVIKGVLFGSLAWGSETRKSDLDLMVIKKTGERFFKRYDEFNEIYDLVNDRNVDLLIYTPEELQSISHRPFIRKILEEGKIIYER